VIAARVTLAWLADPATFPYRLEPVIVGSALEVRGAVANDGIRERALTTARAESGMRVIDALQNGYPTVSRSKALPEVLGKRAAERIRQTLGARGNAIELDVWTEGQVLLKGQVATIQEKLAASQCLQTLHMCSCVVNQLKVLEPSALDEAGPFAFAATRTPPITVGGAAPDGNLYQVKGAAFDSAATGLAVGPANQAHMYPTQWRRSTLEPAPVVRRSPALVQQSQPPLAIQAVNGTPAPAAGSQPTPAVVQAAPPIVDYGVRQASAISTDASSSETTGIAIFTQNGTPAPAAGSQITPAVAQAAPPIVDYGVPRASAISTDASSFETTGIAIFTQNSTPAPAAGSQPTPAVVQAAPPIVDHGVRQASAISTDASSSETTGIAIFTQPESMEQANKHPTLETLRDDLRQKIAARCRRGEQQVQVVVESDKSIMIRITAHDVAEGVEISAKVFQIPELEPFQVSLDVPVTP
jgi:hypothetical protein